MIVPNVGDVLMLSQVSWRISRAFSAGQKSAPIEFQQVETEVGGLARALKQFAEALHSEADDKFSRDTTEHVQHGIGIILDSCKRTIHDLDSLVDHNQVIRKHRTVGGFAIERSWNNLVLAEYATMSWTAEGGDLHCLRDLLHMHTSFIMLLVPAVQRQVCSASSKLGMLTSISKSHTRLESVVPPMADRIDSMFHTEGNLDQQLQEVHRMLQDLMITIPIEISPPVPAKNPARSPIIEVVNPLNTDVGRNDPLSMSPRQVNTKVSLPKFPQRPKSPNQPTSPRQNISGRAPTSPTETMTPSRATSPSQKRVSDFSFSGSSLRYSSGSYASSTASSGGWSSPGTPLIGFQPSATTMKSSHLPRTPEVWEPTDNPNHDALSLLPPPALGHASHLELDRPTSRSTLSPYPSTQPDVVKLHRSSTTSSQKATFEKEAFRNSAVLCDV